MDFALYQNGTDIEDMHSESTLLSVADTNNHGWSLNITVTCYGLSGGLWPVMVNGFATADRSGDTSGMDSPSGNARTGTVDITDNAVWQLEGRWNGTAGTTLTLTTFVVQRLAP